MKARELKKLINHIPDDAEVKFEWEMIYLDSCVVEEYPSHYLYGHPPFYYLKPASPKEAEYIKEILHPVKERSTDNG